MMNDDVVIMAHAHTLALIALCLPLSKLFIASTAASRREEDDHTIGKLYTSDAEVVAPHLVQLWR